MFRDEDIQGLFRRVAAIERWLDAPSESDLGLKSPFSIVCSCGYSLLSVCPVDTFDRGVTLQAIIDHAVSHHQSRFILVPMG